MINSRFFCLVPLLIFTFHLAAQAQDNSLKACQDEVNRTLATPVKDYKADLKELLREFQKAGDLDSFLVVRDEIARFDKNPQLASSNIVKEPELLAIVQSDFQKASYLETNKIAKKYINALTPEQANLTKQGKIDEAMVVRTKVRAIQAAYKESFAWEESSRLAPQTDKVSSRSLIMGFTRTEALAKRIFVDRDMVVGGVVERFDRDFSHGELFNVYFSSFGESDSLVQFAFKISDFEVKKTQVDGKEVLVFTKKGDKEKAPLVIKPGMPLEIKARCEGKHINVNFANCSIPDSYWPAAKPTEGAAE